jgi:hypothetical protein
LSLAAACGDDEATIVDNGGTGGVPSGGAAGSAGAGTAGGGAGGSTAGVGGGGSAGTGGSGTTGGASGAAGTGGDGSGGTGGDEPDAGPDAATLVDAGGSCPADLDDIVNGPTSGATSSTVSQEVIISRLVFDGDDIIVTFRGAPDGPGFNFAEPLVLCTGSQQENCDGGVADLEGSGNVDGGTGILLPGEEIEFVFENAFNDDTETTAEAGELALVNNLVPSELLFPENAFVRAYVNWGGYVSLEPTGDFDGGTVFGSLESRALDAVVWTEDESIEIGANTTIFATGDVTTADNFSACASD